MTKRLLEVGFSPCPNDTFMFHAMMSGIVVVPGYGFSPLLADIEELNSRAVGPDPLPITKLSVGALAAVCDRYAVLPAGAALGRGVGPLVVAKPGSGAPTTLADLAGRRVAIPGERTTAFLLMRLFGPAELVPVQMRFDRILGAVEAGDVDAGLIIHEGRFTYRERGLEQIVDLGQLWEDDTGLPLPLGVIVAERRLPAREFSALAAGLRSSIRYALVDREASRAYVRSHAQELSAEVCDQHIALYVNGFSIDLGDEGRAAIDELLARGRACGALPDSGAPWR